LARADAPELGEDDPRHTLARLDPLWEGLKADY
jgi:hypothetical protein